MNARVSIQHPFRAVFTVRSNPRCDREVFSIAHHPEPRAGQQIRARYHLTRARRLRARDARTASLAALALAEIRQPSSLLTRAAARIRRGMRGSSHTDR